MGKNVRVQAYQEIDGSTQTETVHLSHPYQPTLSRELNKLLCVRVNMYLHAAYWFLMLRVKFIHMDLLYLSTRARKREKTCNRAARKLILHIMYAKGQPVLIDISHPALNLSLIKVEDCEECMNQLETWLSESMQEAYMELVMAEERGDPVDQLLMGVVRTLNAQQ